MAGLSGIRQAGTTTHGCFLGAQVTRTTLVRPALLLPDDDDIAGEEGDVPAPCGWKEEGRGQGDEGSDIEESWRPPSHSAT